MKSATQLLTELNGIVASLEDGRARCEPLRDEASHIQQAIFSVDTALGLLRAAASDASDQVRREAWTAQPAAPDAAAGPADPPASPNAT